MAVPRQTPQVIRFGAFQVDAESGELRKNGIRLRIQEQSFQVLLALLQRHPQLVTREDLRKQLWPTDTFVDFDNGLNKAVARLREVLGDSADDPRYIETLSRKGYRFICPFEAAQNLPATFPRTNTAGVLPPLSQLRWLGLAAAVGAALFVIGTYLWLHRPATNVASASGRIMLAVLPFENLTGDPQQDYFSDGLTEEMITQLGGMAPDRLGVIARTSAMHYKGTTARVAEIGRELNVHYLLEGSVRREGSRVRISAQLIRARDETHVWAQDYDRDLRQYLELEDEIARDIAEQIELKLDARASVSPRRMLDPDAYEDYLKGRFFWNQRSENNYLKAIAYFERAIAKDPGYAQAYAGLADAYALLGSNPTRVFSRQDAMARARAAALKAVAIDDTVAEAHTSLAFIYWHYDWNWAAAEKEFRRALLLNPSYPTAHHWHAFYLLSQGRLEQALQEIRRAQELDPLSLIINTDVGEILFYNRRYDDTIVQERRTLEMNPGFPLARRLLGLCYLQKHDYAEALPELQAKPGDPNDALLTDGTLGVTYAMMGRDRAARAVLDQLEQKAKGLHMQELYLSIAEVHSALGDKDGAFRWLQDDYETRDGGLTLIRLVPVFNVLHSDPRFADLVRRIGLPPMPPT